MSKFSWLLSAVLTMVILAGCASKGFDQESLHRQMGISEAEQNKPEVKSAFARRGALNKPFRLAVYFRSPHSNTGPTTDWKWTPSDQGLIEEVCRDLKASGLISDSYPIMGSVAGEDIKTLHAVAAKYQADGLLVISGADQINRRLNGLALAYLLVLPTLFVPGSESEALFVTHAALWDLKSENLVESAESAASVKETYPAVFMNDEKAMLESAKDKALIVLKHEIRKLINPDP